MTKRTHEIAHTLQQAGLAGMPNLVALAEFVAAREIVAEMRGLRNEDTSCRHVRMKQLRAELGRKNAQGFQVCVCGHRPHKSGACLMFAGQTMCGCSLGALTG